MANEQGPNFNWEEPGRKERLKRLGNRLMYFISPRRMKFDSTEQKPPEHEPLEIPDAPYDPHKPIIRVIKKGEERDPDDWGF